MDEAVAGKQKMPSMFSTGEMEFIRYLDSTRSRGYAQNLLRYEPDRFYSEMRRFFSGKAGDL
jgi:hypothetical protein